MQYGESEQLMSQSVTREGRRGLMTDAIWSQRAVGESVSDEGWG